jgi:hypothetical protein
MLLLGPRIPGFYIQALSVLINAFQINDWCCQASQSILPVVVSNTCPNSLSLAANNNQLMLDSVNTALGTTCYRDSNYSNQIVWDSVSHQNVTIGVKKRCCYFTQTGTLAQNLPYAGLAITNQSDDANFIASCPSAYAVQFRPIANSPPIFNMPAIINATIYTNMSIPIIVSGNVVLSIQPQTSTVNPTNLPTIVYQNNAPYLFWTPSSLTPTSFQVVATDQLGQTHIWIPVVYYCVCLNGGICSFDYLSTWSTIYVPNGIYLADCKCLSNYNGRFCNETVCATNTSPCDPVVSCAVDGSVVTCGSCPTNMQTIGGHCIPNADNPQSPCLYANCSQICVPNYTNASSTCQCYNGYTVNNTVPTGCVGK